MKTWNRWRFLLVATLLAIVSASCHDSELEENPDYVTPTDEYVGSNTLISIEKGCEELDIRDLELFIKAPNGSTIMRNAIHNRRGDVSELELVHGLVEGNYQLLYILYKAKDEEGAPTFKSLGLGCRISFEGGAMEMKSHYNETFKMFCSGSEVDTLYVASTDKLVHLINMSNDVRYNDEITPQTYFLQLCNFDGEELSKDVHRKEGWLPLGYQESLPFRGTYDGGGHSITGLWMKREHMAPLGFIGFSEGAHVRNLNIKRANFYGSMAVGGIVGVATSSEGRRISTFIENCTVSDSNIQGNEDSYGVGGLLGIVDYQSRAHVHRSKSIDNNITATSQAGGVVGAGAMTSALTAYFCENSSRVTSEYNSAGGIVGACDSLAAGGCINRGSINGAVNFVSVDLEKGRNDVGCGGIAGGTGVAIFAGCRNEASVVGRTGVGGILGSSRFSGGDPEDGGYVFNSVSMYKCANYSTVMGDTLVGGLCGEAQFGVYGGYNEGNVYAKGDYAGGMVGNGAMTLIHNCVNKGYIEADSYAGGMVAMSATCSIALNQNYGDIAVHNTHGAGIVAIAGMRATVSYCTNYGDIIFLGATRGLSAGEVLAGIWGEAGDPNDWTALEIGSLVYYSAEIALGLAGAVFGVLDAMKIGGEVMSVLSSLCVFEGVVTIFGDTIFWANGINEKINAEQIREEEEESYKELLEMCNQIENEVTMARNSYVPNLINDFSLGVPQIYHPAQFSSIISYVSSSSENIKAHDDSINQAQYDLMVKLNDQAKAKETFHSVISGIFLAVGAVGAMISIVATGGAAAPVLVAGSVLSGVGAVAGGLNSIWETCTETIENTVQMPQNVNYGYIYSSEGATKCGGIIGIVHENAIIEDCLNVGGGVSGGHIAGEMDRQSNMLRCLTVADEDEFGGRIYSSKGNKVTLENLYYYTEQAEGKQTRSMSDATGLTVEDMRDPSKFANWDFNESNGRWFIPKGNESSERTYPIPYHSIHVKQ